MATEYQVVYGDSFEGGIVTREYADWIAKREGGKVQKREVGDWQDA